MRQVIGCHTTLTQQGRFTEHMKVYAPPILLSAMLAVTATYTAVTATWRRCCCFGHGIPCFNIYDEHNDTHPSLSVLSTDNDRNATQSLSETNVRASTVGAWWQILTEKISVHRLKQRLRQRRLKQAKLKEELSAFF